MEYLCETCGGCNRLLIPGFKGTRNCKNYFNLVEVNEKIKEYIKEEEKKYEKI